MRRRTAARRSGGDCLIKNVLIGRSLAELIADLQERPDFDPTLTGFDEKQLADLLMRPIEDDLEEEEDSPEMITATLEVPHELWAAAQIRLNQLLSEAPGIRLHVAD